MRKIARLAADRRDHQAQAIGVGEAVGFSGGFGLPDDQIGECHHRAPKLRLRLNARHGSRPTPATIRNRHQPYLGLKNAGCRRISVNFAETKKGASAPFFKDLQRPPGFLGTLQIKFWSGKRVIRSAAITLIQQVFSEHLVVERTMLCTSRRCLARLQLVHSLAGGAIFRSAPLGSYTRSWAAGRTELW